VTTRADRWLLAGATACGYRPSVAGWLAGTVAFLLGLLVPLRLELPPRREHRGSGRPGDRHAAAAASTAPHGSAGSDRERGPALEVTAEVLAHGEQPYPLDVVDRVLASGGVSVRVVVVDNGCISPRSSRWATVPASPCSSPAPTPASPAVQPRRRRRDHRVPGVRELRRAHRARCPGRTRDGGRAARGRHRLGRPAPGGDARAARLRRQPIHVPGLPWVEQPTSRPADHPREDRIAGGPGRRLFCAGALGRPRRLHRGAVRLRGGHRPVAGLLAAALGGPVRADAAVLPTTSSSGIR
jgi:hypothetical protein